MRSELEEALLLFPGENRRYDFGGGAPRDYIFAGRRRAAVTMSHATLAFSSAGSATVADLSRDLRDLGQVVDALQRNLLIHPNLERELDHLREGNQNIMNREDSIIKELEGLRLEMKELRAQQAEIMQRENDMKEAICDMRKGHKEVNARQEDMKREIMRVAGC